MRCWMLTVCLLLTSAVPAEDNQLTPEEKAAGWELLFDGMSLGKWYHIEGWKTDRLRQIEGTVQHGAINPHKPTKPYDYMMIYNEPVEDYILTMDFKTEGNSGIFLRTAPLQPSPGKDIGYNAIEVAIDVTTGTGYTDPGALYDLVRPTRNLLRHDAWNHIIVTNYENLITVTLNGEMVTLLQLDEWTAPGKKPDGTPHKFGADKQFSTHPRRGYIGLQDHGANVWYKNIKLRRLHSEAKP